MGSSPLARGLRGTLPGVIAVAGSSPLARGLRQGYPLPAPPPGIIPARAGFTGGNRFPARDQGDHPRSRGVYYGPCGDSPTVLGSSPLARGLRRRHPPELRRLRIIPARAGFTHPLQHEGSELEDHPRSRGVYGSASTPAPAMSGSSPLARGLPARPALPRRRPPDHPRSRGVYALADEAEYQWGGSSPLARGLRHGHDQILRPEGIIPARAGFTVRMSLSVMMGPDHPRSRGVYMVPAGRSHYWRGSSPLARGLPRVAVPAGGLVGIIPARAGFTSPTTAGCLPAGDHPRSRGVYWNATLDALSAAGSSPLARGLRPPPRTRTRPARIIPARAGFTEIRRVFEALRTDHPRSRGVYPMRHGKESR